MKLFNRQIPGATKPQSSTYPTNQPREHQLVAWLLAFATFVITLAIILALFFGGKWIYRKISHKESSTSQQSSQPQGDTSKTPQNNGSSGNGNNQNSDNGNSQTTDNSSSEHTNSAPQTSSTSTSQPSQAVTRTPNTGPESPELIRTGPDQDL